MYDAIFPLSKFLGIGKCHFTIKISEFIEKPEEKFQNIILSLRLLKPFEISIAGSVEFDNGEDSFKKFSLIQIRTTINAGHSYAKSSEEKYSCQDIKDAQELATKISFLYQNKDEYKRIVEAVGWFRNAIFCRASHAMIFNALFSCLEALFGSPAKAFVLAERVALFLDDFTNTDDMKDKQNLRNLLFFFQNTNLIGI